MSGLGELFGAAAKELAEKALQGIQGKVPDVISKAISSTAFIGASVGSDTLLEKMGIQKKNANGEVVIVPMLKHIESKMKKTLKINPDREKLCFHFPTFKSVKDGTDFLDPDGKIAFSIPHGSRNYKHLTLYKDGASIGEIKEKMVLLKNPLTDPTKYEIFRNRGFVGTVTVKNQAMVNTAVVPDFERWNMVSKWGSGDYTVIDKNDEELGKVYLLGDQYYVMDYVKSLDPRIMILAFMCALMKKEKEHVHYKNARMFR